MTGKVKAAINRKTAAFFSWDKEKMKAAQKELKAIIYKEKDEGQMSNRNTKGLWKGMKTICGYGISHFTGPGLAINVNEAKQFCRV